MVMTQANKDTLCPVCGEANECRIANGCLYKGACWCDQADVPAHVLRFLVEGQLEPACLCRRCLATLAHDARSLDDTPQALARVPEEISRHSNLKDSYLDELGRVVFTADYHLRRGYCCGNNCRHCPFVGSDPTL